MITPPPTLTVGSIAGIALLTTSYLRRRFVVVTVTGESMTPALNAGERVLIQRVPAARIRPGQVVVLLQSPDGGDSAPTFMIKRVAAVAGDPVAAEFAAAFPGRAPDRVPPGALLVLGDNRPVSLDSRRLGPIPAGLVLGVMVRRLHRRGTRVMPAGKGPAAAR